MLTRPSLDSFLWGVVVILTVVIESYEGLVVQRVFLGFLEVRPVRSSRARRWAE